MGDSLAALLPEPEKEYEKYITGMFSLLSFFLSSDDDGGTGLILQAIQQAVSEIENYIREFNFEEIGSKLRARWAYLNQCLKTLKDTRDDGVLPDWKSFLQDQAGADTADSAYNLTHELWDLHIVTTMQKGALDLWSWGETLVLMCRKLLIQTVALEEAKANLVGDQAQTLAARATWWGHYDQFANEVAAVTPRAWRFIQDQIDNRLCRVVMGTNVPWAREFAKDTAVGGNIYDSYGVFAERRPWDPWGPWNPAHTGQAKPDPTWEPDAVLVSLSWSWNANGTPTVPVVQLDVIQRAYRDYIAGKIGNASADTDPGLASQLDTAVAGIMNTIDQWVSQLATWVSAVPPRAPANPPSWTLNEDNGNRWPDGAILQYSYSLGNVPSENGPSLGDASGLPTRWTANIKPQAAQYPKLTFSAAEDKMAGGTARYVYRKITLPASSGKPGSITISEVAAMTVNETTWTDTYVYPSQQST